jgi:hypothetical protein|tara:strand:+ start:203 stop:427 length:225 start_codon:yes stop_codon:yes gene_type:complete
MDYSREQINRFEEEYNIPHQGDIERSIHTLVEKVEIAIQQGRKVSNESREAIKILNQLIKANDHPFGGWAIFRP